MTQFCTGPCHSLRWLWHEFALNGHSFCSTFGGPPSSKWETIWLPVQTSPPLLRYLLMIFCYLESANGSPASAPFGGGEMLRCSSAARLVAASLQCEYMKKPAMAVTTPTDILTVNSLLSPADGAGTVMLNPKQAG